MKEIWKPILGFEGLYKISNFGNLKRLKRVVIRNNGREYKVTELILKPSLDAYGYLNICLHNEGLQSNRTVHSLVAEAFLNHTRCRMESVIRHINGNKSDNRVCNLEIVNNIKKLNPIPKIKMNKEQTTPEYKTFHEKWKGKNFMLDIYPTLTSGTMDEQIEKSLRSIARLTKNYHSKNKLNHKNLTNEKPIKPINTINTAKPKPTKPITTSDNKAGHSIGSSKKPRNLERRRKRGI